ncbi:MAG TPA: AraC family transcriptional regulator [Abditibacteriaceae bacterium]|jgi:AraC-like DNA-binding protein
MHIPEHPVSVHSAYALDLHLRIFVVREKNLGTHEWKAQQMCDPFWRFYANERDGFDVSWQDDGKSETLSMRGGSCYLIPAGVPFSGRNSASGRHFYIHFDILGLPAFSNLRNPGFAMQPLEAPLGAEVRAALLQPLAEQSRLPAEASDSEPVAPLSALRARALLSLAFAALMESGGLSLVAPDRESKAIRPALEWIEAHLHQTLTNDVLAQRCHFCSDYFIERFKRAMGITPAQYVLERRLSVAAQQLLFSVETIEAIAAATGFCDRFHFSRAFKQRFGTSPVSYRKNRPA